MAAPWSWRRSAPVVPMDATRRPSLREMESISLMLRARRLRVSLPLCMLAALLLSTCNTLAFVLRPATDGEDALLPRLLLQAWTPCSHLFGPPLLLALQPCDRLGTFWAAVVFTSVCTYATVMLIFSWPSVHAFDTTRAVLLLCVYLLWVRCVPAGCRTSSARYVAERRALGDQTTRQPRKSLAEVAGLHDHLLHYRWLACDGCNHLSAGGRYA